MLVTMFIVFLRAVSADDCNAHMATHEAEPRFQCQADGCDFSCRALKTFKNHFRSVHLKESGPVYCCHLCDKKYNRGPCLGMHLRMVHKLERLPGHCRFRLVIGIRNMINKTEELIFFF